MSEYDTAALCGAHTDRGYNQHTASGLPFWCGDPQAEDIRTHDIIMQLSRICRFGGAIRDDIEMYSVAQHCCLVSDHCPPELQFEGLMHDAHEAYVGDKVKPLKLILGDAWAVLEHRVEAAVRAKYGLPVAITPEVKRQDWLAVVTERRDILTPGSVDWGQNLPAPWDDKIQPWDSRRAAYEFQMRFWLLTGRRD